MKLHIILALVSLGYKNIELTKVRSEIWVHDNKVNLRLEGKTKVRATRSKLNPNVVL